MKHPNKNAAIPVGSGAGSTVLRKSAPGLASDYEVASVGALFSEGDPSATAAAFEDLLFSPHEGTVPLEASERARRPERARTGGPKSRTIPVATAIGEHYQRRRTSLEEAILEIYHADLSIKKAEDLTESLWGKRVDLGRIGELAREVSERIEAALAEPLSGDYPYVFVEGTPLRRGSGSDAICPSILIAIGVNREGRRELLAVGEGSCEDRVAAEQFWRRLKARGLSGTRLIVGDRCPPFMQAAGEIFPAVAYQTCVATFCDRAISVTSGADLFQVTELLHQIHEAPDAASAREVARRVQDELRELDLEVVAEFIDEAIADTLHFYALPKAHWTSLRSNESLRRIVREIRERARVVGAFSDGPTAVIMAAARLRQIARKSWTRYQYLRAIAPDETSEAHVA